MDLDRAYEKRIGHKDFGKLNFGAKGGILGSMKARLASILMVLSLLVAGQGVGTALADSGPARLNLATGLVDLWNKNIDSADALVNRLMQASETHQFDSFSELQSTFQDFRSKLANDSAALESAFAENESYCLTATTEFGISISGSSSCVQQLIAAFPVATKKNPKVGDNSSSVVICLETTDALNAAKDARSAATDAVTSTTKILQDFKAAADKAAADKAAADKAAANKAAATAKPTSSVKPTPSPSSTVATKPTTIICIKGKLTKTVTGLKPVCPSGYRKK